MSIVTYSFKAPKPDDGVGYVNESTDIPKMRARTGKRGTDRRLTALLREALEDLSSSDCGFWACEGPNRPIGMMMCRKCAAMRMVATVAESLKARG